MVHKNRKIAVLGTGNVGATIAYTLTLSDICSEIVLVDINKEKAEGEALDLSQCGAVVSPVKIRSGEYEDVAGADIVVVTFGVGRKPGQSRLDLANINIGILRSVMPKVAKIAPDAMYVIVSNPVDILTYETIKCTGLPINQVIGTGTLLDSNRLSVAIADYCGVDVGNVTSFVLGEHGESCMVPWSICSVCGIPLIDYCVKVLRIEEQKVQEELVALYEGMVKSGAKVIAAKGATFYAIAASTVSLIKAILSDSDFVLPLSTLLGGEYGANGLCMGVPCMVDSNGFKKVVELPLTEQEKAILKEKVAAIDNVYKQLGLK